MLRSIGSVGIMFLVLWVLAALLWQMTGGCMAMHGWLLESSYVLCLVGCSVCAACMRYCTQRLPGR